MNIMDIMTDVLVRNWIELSLIDRVNGWVCISNYAGEFYSSNFLLFFQSPAPHFLHLPELPSCTHVRLHIS